MANTNVTLLKNMHWNNGTKVSISKLKIEFVSNQNAVNTHLGHTFNISRIEVNIFFQFVFEEVFYTILWYIVSIQNTLHYLEF